MSNTFEATRRSLGIPLDRWQNHLYPLGTDYSSKLGQRIYYPDRLDMQVGATNYQEYAGFGYQYQWWIPPDTDGDFVALGHRGQFLYINPKHQVVIVKTSAAEKPLNSEVRLETIALLRAIANSF